MQDLDSQAPAVGGAASADLSQGSQRHPPLPWAIHRRVGSPASLFAAEPPFPSVPEAGAAVVVHPDRPAVVLGSAQRDDVVDPARAGAAGVAVVRRRSGGGAVWLDPTTLAWVDVVVPRGHPRWDDDVGRACWWVGEAWSAALVALGLGRADGAAAPVVHRGAMAHSPWSRLVCFAGLGPGEVTVGGRKVVGIAQRRTRAGALFQCGALLRWDPAPLLDVLTLGESERAGAIGELRGACAGLAELVGPSAGGPPDAQRVADAFLDELRAR